MNEPRRHEAALFVVDERDAPRVFADRLSARSTRGAAGRGARDGRRSRQSPMRHAKPCLRVEALAIGNRLSRGRQGLEKRVGTKKCRARHMKPMRQLAAVVVEWIRQPLAKSSLAAGDGFSAAAALRAPRLCTFKQVSHKKKRYREGA